MEIVASQWDHPRIRGEHGHLEVTVDPIQGSSPHTRGALWVDDGTKTGARIIPAYAGSTFPSLASTSARRDHPRIRGEHADIIIFRSIAAGSSPHTRGARLRQARPPGIERIIPAYAGSTPGCPSPSGAGRDHPRIRGEHPLPHSRPHGRPGSSPHTRGAPHAEHCSSRKTGIIPAYAGSTAPPPQVRRSGPDHPRIRGEH